MRPLHLHDTDRTMPHHRASTRPSVFRMIQAEWLFGEALSRVPSTNYEAELASAKTHA